MSGTDAYPLKKRVSHGVVQGLVLAVLAMSSAAAQVRGVSDNEIVLGSFTDLSGIGASWGVSGANGVRMRVDELNAQGGIHGRKIRLIVEDHGYQVPRAVQAASKLIQRDNVFAMIAPVGTPMVNAAMPMMMEANVPNMFPAAFARSVMVPQRRLVFQTYPMYYTQMRSAVKYFVEKRGRKQLCTMYQDTDYGREIGDAVRDQAKEMGMTVVAESTHAPTDTDFNSAIAKLRAANCDVVFMGTVVRDTIVPYSTARRMGWNADFVGNATSFLLNVAEAPNKATEGLFMMSAFDAAYPDAALASTRDWAARYVSLFKIRPNVAAQVHYVATDLTVKALQNAGRNLTTDSFIAGMEKIRDYKDPFGGPVLSYGPNRHTGTDQLLLQQVQNGRWMRVAGPF